ncbi:MAG TPA: TetR/AcrR family transcriptional regulator [Solirubrobacterales bacterium]|nr:TetR/AcrR family transcriptional regulator [Solirubrobacterales bacterium]
MSGRGEKRDDRLGSLPPGRHGLSRDFVTRNQRERLAAGTIAAVAEKGYRDTGVTAISAAAGVSRRTFYSYYRDKEDCFLSTYDLFERHLLSTLAEGSTAKSWPALVRERIARLLAFLSRNTDLVLFALAAPPKVGGVMDDRARRFLERLVDSLTEGGPADATPVELGTVAGTLSAVLVAYVESSQDLADAAPELVELTLTPFLGRKKAIAESKLG